MIIDTSIQLLMFYHLIVACLQDRITKQQPGLTGTNLEKAVKGSGRYLTELINDLIKCEVKNSKK